MASPSSQPPSLDPFFAGLRKKGFHLGLDPEFSAIQTLALAPPQQRLATLREYIDLFYWGRGFPVLEKLLNKAKEQNDVAAGQIFGSMGNAISQMLAGQFAKYPPNQQIPQSAILREMLRLFNEGGTEALEACIDQNLPVLDGHLFMLLAESLRTARQRGAQQPSPEIELTTQVLFLIGALVSRKRPEHGLPCSFGALYTL